MSDKPLPAAEPSRVDTGSTPFVEVASRVLPSVVSISVYRPQPILPSVRLKTPFDRFFRRQTVPQIPRSEVNVLGSGMIIDERGYVLTNYHVVRSFTGLLVKLNDNTTFKDDKVKLIGSDEKSDLALLKIATPRRLTAVKFGDSDSVKIGDWAIALGNPFGLQGSVSVGVISATGRSGLVFPEAPSYQDFIQTDAATNPGSSGGPLANLRGEVIGVNTAIRSSGEGSVGIGFAVPINTARQVSEQLMNKGKVVRGYLGLTIQEISPDLKDAMGLANSEGVLVTDVVAGSPAAAAGIKPDDVITLLDGEPVGSLDHFREVIASMPPGTKVRLTIVRGGNEQELAVKLTSMPEQPIAEKPKPAPVLSAQWLGLTVVDLSDTDRKASGQSKGVKVSAVEPGTPADDAGILVGDIITKVNKRTLSGIKDFQSIASSLAGSARPVTFELIRSKTRYSITVTPD